MLSTTFSSTTFPQKYIFDKTLYHKSSKYWDRYQTVQTTIKLLQTEQSQYMPGNVIRCNKNYANEILVGSSGHGLQTVNRLSTNLLSCYLLISKRQNRHLGNAVLNRFHFYTRLIIKICGKSSCQLSICFLV